MGVPHFDLSLRSAAMEFIAEQPDEIVTGDLLQKFVFDGRRIPLMDRQRGIRKPTVLKAALSIRTTFTLPGKSPPYLDAEGPDGLLRYMFAAASQRDPEITRRADRSRPSGPALRRVPRRELTLIKEYPMVIPLW